MSFNLVAAVTLQGDFGAQENKVSHYLHCFSIYMHEVMGQDATILYFSTLSCQFLLTSFVFVKRLFNFSSLSVIVQFSSAQLLSCVRLFVTP